MENIQGRHYIINYLYLIILIVAVRPQPIRALQSIGEKLNSLYQQDEPKQVVIPQKVRIIEEQVLVPAFVVPQFPELKKRKAQTIDLSKRLLNMVRSHGSMKRVSSSQSSQHSQLSQKSQENQVPVEPATVCNLFYLS